MSAEVYLSSPEVVADVAQLLRGRPEPLIGAPAISVAAAGRLLLSVNSAQAWKTVHLRIDDTEERVYFRPEGDPDDRFRADCSMCVGGGEPCTVHEEVRYIVTDLGEAVRALRLRTGRLGIDPWPALDDDAVAVTYSPSDGVLLAMEAEGGDKIVAADLPRAIVRVMLAAHRVATLSVPPSL